MLYPVELRALAKFSFDFKRIARAHHTTEAKVAETVRLCAFYFALRVAHASPGKGGSQQDDGWTNFRFFERVARCMARSRRSALARAKRDSCFGRPRRKRQHSAAVE